MSGKEKTVETSSSQTQTNDVTQTQSPWAAQVPYLEKLFGRAEAAYNTGGPQYFAGQTVADRSADTTAAHAYARNLAANQIPQATSGTIDSLNWAMGPGRDVANNPYLASAIQAAQQPVIQNFSSVGGPLAQIRGHYTGANSGGSGTREGIAEGIAMRGLGQTLANQSAEMTMQAYTQAQQNALQAAGLMPGAVQSAAYPAQLLAGVGADQQAYQQQLINAEMERHNWNQNLPWLNLNNYQQMIQGNYGGTSHTGGTVSTVGTSTQPAGSSSPFSSLLGGAATAGGVLGMLGQGGISSIGGVGLGTIAPWAMLGAGALGALGSRR